MNDEVNPELTATLTIETLLAAKEQIEKATTYSVCGSPERPHVVHPQAPRLTMCAECFMPLDLARENQESQTA